MDLTYIIDLIFTIFVCIIITNSLKNQLFLYYEQLVVTLTTISLVLYVINIVLGSGFLMQFSIFTPYGGSSEGSLLIYNINSNTDVDGKTLFGLIRNCGFAWEPGRFASMIIIAIVINLCRTRFKFSRNKQLYILLIGLFTTFSTTGYVTLMIIILCFAITKFKRISKVFVISFMIIASLFVMDLPFIREKINDNYQTESYITTDYNYIQNVEKSLLTGDGVRTTFTPQRFECISIDFLNFREHPFTGYGMDRTKSFAYNNISEYITLTNGFIREFALWGVIIGLLFNIFLIKSSMKIPILFNSHNNKWVFVITYYLLSISYVFILDPAIISIFLFTLFANFDYEKNFNYNDKL